MATLAQLERFAGKIVVGHDGPWTNGEPCWLWQGAQKGGSPGQRYGNVTVEYYSWLAHRWIYQAMGNELIDGLQIDHLCRVRLCVNPAHLEQVTPRENVLRGDTITKANAEKVRCAWGHDLSGANLFVNSEGRRVCRTCKRKHERINARRYRAKKKVALNG